MPKTETFLHVITIREERLTDPPYRLVHRPECTCQRPQWGTYLTYDAAKGAAQQHHDDTRALWK